VNLKGQSSIEFLSLVSMSALILAGMYGVMLSKQEKAVTYSQQSNAQKIAEKTSFQVEMALVQGDGYSRVFNLPKNLGGNTYNLTIKNETTIVEWQDKQLYRSTLYSDKELNISTQNSYIFKVMNKDGSVKLEAVS
jgi:hypothetical protein